MRADYPTRILCDLRGGYPLLIQALAGVGLKKNFAFLAKMDSPFRTLGWIIAFLEERKIVLDTILSLSCWYFYTSILILSIV
jgi:hypothetical protein